MRSRVRPIGRRLKNNYIWVAAAVDGFTSVAAGAGVAATLIQLTDNASDLTLMRIRGLVTIAPGNAESWGAIGIIKLPDSVTTQFPGPWTGGGYDWIWHHYWAQSPTQLTAVGLEQLSIPIEIDSKAMRRLDDNEYLALIVENQGTGSITFNYGVRQLIKAGKR